MKQNHQPTIASLTDEDVDTRFRPASELGRGSRVKFFWMGVVGFTCAVLSIAAIWAEWQFGSVAIGLHWLRGETTVVTPSRVVVGEYSGGPRQGIVTIHNLSREPLRILGAHGACKCLVVDDLPLEVGGRDRREIMINVLDSETESDFSYDVLFYTDRNVNHPLHVVISGAVE